MPTENKSKPDTTLSTLFQEPKSYVTSIGTISIDKYKLRHIAKINKYITEIFRAIKIDGNIDLMKKGALQDAIKGIDFLYLLYTLTSEDSECLWVLLESATNMGRDELGELTDAEAVMLIKDVFQISVFSMLTEMGKGLGVNIAEKLKD